MDVAVMFSGGCGTSVGAKQAGARVVWAANHSPACVAVHRANFPECDTVCQDLHLFNHAKMRPHDALLASPVCRGSSKAGRPARAKGGKIQSAHNAMRTLAWSVIDALEVNRPKFVAVENVPEFEDWDLYDVWRRALSRLGYRCTSQVLDASRFGVPQKRTRLFVVGVHEGKRIRLKNPDTEPPAMLDFIDWDAGEWLPFSACRGEKARAQLARAHATYGGRPSFISLVGHRPVFSADEPLRTMTTQDQVRFVKDGRFRYPTAEDAFSLMGFPSDYTMPDVGRTLAWAMAGDAVCPPVMRAITERLLAA